MTRWEPNAEERLRAAAIELFLERGYENVTVAQIAERAGLTRRTFSRYFADKRDVLFAGSDQLPGALADAMRRVDSTLAPFQAMLQALADVSEMLAERVAEYASQRREVIAASPELQERGHAKFAAVAAGLAAGLRERGADPSAAELFADVGVAIFRRGFDRWAAAPREATLASRIHEAANQLRDAAENISTT
ncbi:TetR family transcriptional regulator [Diaminobutyricibacter sp. McL0608]|uniref:TetR family transcriptional regulator n=1 Tax=Leifsonia sp. McL0608 TaxID=3143537 RepID=UPI0031F315F8